ncbi:MAG: methylated-DNA--[Clostridia bacterium]|nr:methylated-DNA--[protein]-cysteine S-methyltransferase [Clostridia bacterium]
MDCIYHYESPLGGITLAGDGSALTGLWFDGQAHFAESLSASCEDRMLPVFTEAEHWLDRYFSGRIPDFTPALNPRGTPFRRLVWKYLLTVPYGETVTYDEIADRLSAQTGRRISARAVGGAVGHNPVSLIIPCHRVVGADGRLTGYAGGLDRKTKLLRMEQETLRGR